MGEVEASIIWKGEIGRGEALLAAISPDDPEDFSVELRKDGKSILHRKKITLNVH